MTVAAGNGRYDFYIDEVDTDVANNRSTVSWHLNGYDTSGSSWSNSASTVNVTVNGSSHTTSYTWSSPGSGTRQLASGSQVITHNSDGSKTISFSWSFSGIPGASAMPSTGTQTGSLPLTTLTRAAVFTSAPGIVAGDDVTFKWTDPSSSYRYTIEYIETDGTNHTIASNLSGGSYTWTGDNNAGLATLRLNGTSFDIKMRVVTALNGDPIGNTDHTVTVTLPASMKPNAGTLTTGEGNAAVRTLLGSSATNTGTFLAGQSTINAATTGASGSYNSYITSAYMYFIDELVARQTFTTSGSDFNRTASGVPSSTTIDTVRMHVTDSRGRTDDANKTVTVLPYAPPAISSVSVARANSSGVAQSDGQYVKVTLSAHAQSLLVGGVEKNVFKKTVQYRQSGTSTWITAANQVSIPITTTGDTTLIGTGATFDTAKSYEVLVTLSDGLKTVTSQKTVSTAIADLYVGSSANGKGVAIHKYWTRGALDVDGEIYASPAGAGLVQTSVNIPAGAWSASAAQSAGTGADVHQALNTITNPAAVFVFGGISGGGIVIPKTGWYMVEIEHLWSASSSGMTSQYLSGVSVNGATFAIGQFQSGTASATGSWRQESTHLIYVSAGDTIGPIARQSTGATLTVQCAAFRVIYMAGQ